MSSQYGCVVVCVNVLACGQPKCKQCWTTGQSDFLVRDWLMMLMMSSTSGGSENANLDCFWWRSSIPSILRTYTLLMMWRKEELQIGLHSFSCSFSPTHLPAGLLREMRFLPHCGSVTKPGPTRYRVSVATRKAPLIVVRTFSHHNRSSKYCIFNT